MLRLTAQADKVQHRIKLYHNSSQSPHPSPCLPSSRDTQNTFRLNSLSGQSDSRSKKGPKDPFPTIASADDSVECILPPNRIRRTDDVDVSRDDKTISKAEEAHVGPWQGFQQHQRF